jgi:hypothetical protein
LCLTRGEFEWNSLKPVFVLFYVALLLSTYHAARCLVPSGFAFAATALTALLPAVATRLNVGGYADMPQGCFVIATVGALLSKSISHRRGFDHPAPWLLCGTVLVKGEGSIVLTVVCLIVVIAWILRGRTAFLSQCRAYKYGLAIVTIGIAARGLSIWWVSAFDPTYGPIDRAHFLQAFERWRTVPEECLKVMRDFSEWGWFWPAFFLCLSITLLRGPHLERLVAVGAALLIGAYSFVFYWTNWDLKVHIIQAYGRLLSQVAPVASIVIVAALVRLAGIGRPNDSENQPDFG